MKAEPVNPQATKMIGRAIIREWINAVKQNRDLDPHDLAKKIRGQVVSGGAHGPLELGVITDPVHRELDVQGNPVKFIWVCIPAPEQMTQGWLTSSGYATVDPNGDLVPNDAKTKDLGEAVLFGCGR